MNNKNFGLYKYLGGQKQQTAWILLYKELAKGLSSDNKVIKELLSKLEVNADSSKSNISGWLIIRAKKFLKNDKYNGDLDAHLSNI